MHQPIEYDFFADIYDIWTGEAPAAKRNLPFYVEEYLRTAGPVVELGVGNGRIAIEAARRGKPNAGGSGQAQGDGSLSEVAGYGGGDDGRAAHECEVRQRLSQ